MARKCAPPTRKKNDTSIREMNAMRGNMRISGGVSKILNKKSSQREDAECVF